MSNRQGKKHELNCQTMKIENGPLGDFLTFILQLVLFDELFGCVVEQLFRMFVNCMVYVMDVLTEMEQVKTTSDIRFVLSFLPGHCNA